MYSNISKIFKKTNTSKFASDLMKNSKINKFSNVSSKNFSVISNTNPQAKVKVNSLTLKLEQQDYRKIHCIRS